MNKYEVGYVVGWGDNSKRVSYEIEADGVECRIGEEGVVMFYRCEKYLWFFTKQVVVGVYNNPTYVKEV